MIIGYNNLSFIWGNIMTKRVYSVAIDGPAGAGKSTIARRAAAELGFVYMDTGAIYRTVAYAVLKAGKDPSDAASVEEFLPTISIVPTWDESGLQHMLLCGEDVSDRIRSPEVSQNASVVSAFAAVRDFLLETQRSVAREYSVIMDGRDIGTIVLPNADIKIFLTASAEVRAQRRFLELQGKNTPTSYEEVLAEMIERDLRDTQRAVAPLRQAEDAVLLDTSYMNLEESISAVISLVREATGL